jgi:hypothetical protein
MRVLSSCFVGSIVALLILTVSPKEANGFALVIVAVLMAFGIGFYVALGVLANRLDRSWITWIGLTVITNPIGPFVAYFKMRKLVLALQA